MTKPEPEQVWTEREREREIERERSVRTKKMGHLWAGHQIHFLSSFSWKISYIVPLPGRENWGSAGPDGKELGFPARPDGLSTPHPAGLPFLLQTTVQEESLTNHGGLDLCGPGRFWFPGHHHCPHAYQGVWLLGGRSPASSSLWYFSKNKAQRQSDQG